MKLSCNTLGYTMECIRMIEMHKRHAHDRRIQQPRHHTHVQSRTRTHAPSISAFSSPSSTIKNLSACMSPCVTTVEPAGNIICECSCDRTQSESDAVCRDVKEHVRTCEKTRKSDEKCT